MHINKIILTYYFILFLNIFNGFNHYFIAYLLLKNKRKLNYGKYYLFFKVKYYLFKLSFLIKFLK